jgi:hypothetical protein
MLTDNQVHKALTDILGYDAIDALIRTADDRSEAELLASGGVWVTIYSTTDTPEPARYAVTIGSHQ